jgi:hypothetical protein
MATPFCSAIQDSISIDFGFSPPWCATIFDASAATDGGIGRLL